MPQGEFGLVLDLLSTGYSLLLNDGVHCKPKASHDRQSLATEGGEDTVISSGRKRSYEAALETHNLKTADLSQEACQRPRIWQQHPQYTQDTDMDEPFADSTPAVKKRCNKPLCTMMMRTGTCVRGSRCVFQHPDPISLPAVRFNRWGLPLRPDELSCPEHKRNLGCCSRGRLCPLDHPEC